MTASPRVGIVAGSGIELEALLDEVTQTRAFREVPGLKDTAISGHAGRILEGRSGGCQLVLQCGRLHFYEGYSYERATESVTLMRDLGVESILFTNAAGGLVPSLVPGQLMAVSEISPWPYRGWPDMPAQLELDFTVPDCDRSGTYIWVHGPCYETPAEVAALRALKGDAVGMSTAPEVARCHELGLKAGAISCITNSCGASAVLTHDHVIQTARAASSKLRRVIRHWLKSAEHTA